MRRALSGAASAMQSCAPEREARDGRKSPFGTGTAPQYDTSVCCCWIRGTAEDDAPLRLMRGGPGRGRDRAQLPLLRCSGRPR